ncbi:COX15/CtaA family protein [Catelliglobosispora koreensis]|uniref:hypothetical protein n=1 Tax=Catelliglobosispora koreensis TaxID=129052 RepID=UPI00037D0360|nr:hypothetical protein [Catelliglobosispora koreensis]
MRSFYRILAYVIAAEVAIQAMVMVYAVAGLGKWVEGGGVLDKSVMESEATPFSEVVGFAIHGINGMMVIPALALILLIVAFFVKVAGAVKFALIVVGLVALQIVLGLLGHGVPFLGALHGLNAFLLVGASLAAARNMRAAPDTITAPRTTSPTMT